MTDSSAIMTDAHTDDGFDGEDDSAAEAAFLKNLTARKEPSKGDEEATETEEAAPSEETESDEETTEAEEETEAKPEKSAVELGDDTTVRVKVNGEEVDVSLGELKRLAGQEKALTHKAMEVAEARKAYETNAAQAKTVLDKALAKAQERLKPYLELDYLDLHSSMDRAAFQQLRKDALAAQQDVKDLETDIADHAKTSQATAQGEFQKAAKAAVEVLQGPVEKGGIEGWSQPLYNDLMAYAVAQGMPASSAHSIVDPTAIKLLHKAMMFDKGKTAATAQIAKVKVAPAKVAKPASNGTPQPTKKATEAFSRLANSHSDDDAVAAFMATLRR